jgi:hypothetical protein
VTVFHDGKDNYRRPAHALVERRRRHTGRRSARSRPAPAPLTFQSTSLAEPRTSALGDEPTEVEPQSLGLAADIFVVQLDLAKAVAGR